MSGNSGSIVTISLKVTFNCALKESNARDHFRRGFGTPPMELEDLNLVMHDFVRIARFSNIQLPCEEFDARFCESPCFFCVNASGSKIRLADMQKYTKMKLVLIMYFKVR